MIITRWNPSANGALHLGHIYSLLVNEHFAHDNGGKFHVRFDDTSQAITIEMEHPERADDIVKHQIEDIKWLGINVDSWQKQSDILEEVHEKMQPRYAILKDQHPHYLPTSIKFGNSWIPYPYTPFQTAERVVMDYMLGVSHIIRGEEFLTEYSLYCYFCEMFDYPRPEFIFLPRLQSKFGDISKTNGGFKISEFRANGYTPKDVIHLIEVSCLNWYMNGWNILNLKQNPKLDI